MKKKKKLIENLVVNFAEVTEEGRIQTMKTIMIMMKEVQIIIINIKPVISKN